MAPDWEEDVGPNHPVQAVEKIAPSRPPLRSESYARSLKEVRATGKLLVLDPMHQAEAARLVEQLLGSYTSPQLYDPKGWITSTVATFIEYPRWAGEQALVRLKKNCPDFPPNAGQVRRELEELVQPQRAARQARTAVPFAPARPAPTVQERGRVGRKLSELVDELKSVPREQSTFVSGAKVTGR